LLVVSSDVSALAGRGDLGYKQGSGMIKPLLCQAKLLKGCISAVLSWGYLAIEKIIYSHLGIIILWGLHTVLISNGSSIADKILFCKYSLVPFH
jgi:hypothetical protein